MCEDCGVFPAYQQGKLVGYTEHTPSDCHELGGHYTAYYNTNGDLEWDGRPWQVGKSPERLPAADRRRALYRNTPE